MTNAQELEEMMGMVAHHQALALQHQRQAQRYQEQCIALAIGGVSAKVGANQSGPNCLRVWARYLDEHGPSLRQEIQDETGVKFTERATPYTVMWDDGMAAYSDDHYAADTIVRMRSVRHSDGRAGTQTAYFLWSQRFDVFDRFGVGPRERVSPALLGVIHPPTETQTFEIEHTVENQDVIVSLPEVEVPEYERYATMEEWAERWNPVFDETAPYNAQPTDEEKAAMRATLPEDTGGEPWTVVLARSYQEAKLRSQS
jgi:hypothetical protein